MTAVQKEDKNHRKTKEAFLWITDILDRKRVPFMISGGFAAKIYGSKRKLNDIDIDIHDNNFTDILSVVEPYLTYGPSQYKDERWDLFLMTLKYDGQEIDISGGDNIKICDARTLEWKRCPMGLSRALEKNVFGRIVKVVHPKDLIDYKSMLAGNHQKEDIEAAKKYAIKYL